MTFVAETTAIPPPRDIRINNKPESANMSTRSTGTVAVFADISPALQNGQKSRIYMQISSDNWVTFAEHRTPWVKPATFYADTQMTITLNNLRQNTHFRIRLRTEQPGPIRSFNFNSADFWTNRAPNVPELVAPTDNTQFLTSTPVVLDWKFSDPDAGDEQVAYNVRWREAANRDTLAGAWTSASGGIPTTHTIPANTFRANRFYEWQVQYRDIGGLWSEWSLVRSLYILGSNTPPKLLSPIGDVGVDVTDTVEFLWQFNDPDAGDTQANADLRYRAAGTSDWFVLTGVGVTDSMWSVPPDVLVPNVHYEWQVRTYDVGSGGATASEWSPSGFFYSIRTPGELSEKHIPLGPQVIQGALGCGDNRVFVYARGGQELVGEILPIESVQWERRRDDISSATVFTNGFDSDCGQMLGRLRSWVHELVIFRDGVRVWEGPITRITYTVDNVEIEAKDVMAYVYRRIMRQGYDDSYHRIGTDGKPVYDDSLPGTQLGLTTGVHRCQRIIIDALARYDPNVLPYLTVLDRPNDAQQSRVVPDYAKTAWEEVDDLAATAGVDYTTVGRRIMLWDTHNPIGKLPEMRDEDFSSPVIVSEYGMNLANYFAVTTGNGVWGAAYPSQTFTGILDLTLTDPFVYYGPIEMLASSYGDTNQSANPQTLTPASRAQLELSLAQQAQRNIAHRWPSPVVVRVPDNSSLNPELNLGINQLVPGVWIPLRATKTCRVVAQWQKLDSVTVSQGSGREAITVVMSPAPNGGDDDPDSDATGTEGA